MKTRLLSTMASLSLGAFLGCSSQVVDPVSSNGTGGHGGAGPPSLVGAPCTPVEEGLPPYAGASLSGDTIQPNSPQCGGGVCLVNHFQGRVSCPLGQPAPVKCTPGGGECPERHNCVEAGEDTHVCRPWGAVCQNEGSLPEDGSPPPQSASAQICCAAGSNTPVTEAVCGQCEAESYRGRAAVFCSCRCGLAEGQPDTGAELCSCPDDMECAEVRPYLGDVSHDLAGKYCIPRGSAFDGPSGCGTVYGYLDQAACEGSPP
jgi:hypothetical protein